ncbi:MAG TPA: VOC family protein [Myxococcota bacterium]|nr:VOC family protein [Myxococcota bacterium]
MTRIRQLGYLGLEVGDLAAWERFAVEVLGLFPSRRGADGSLALRMDDHEQRIVLHPGRADDLAYLGFEVATEAELEALGGALVCAGFAVGEGKPETCAARRVVKLLQLADPSGIPVELFCGASLAQQPFRSPQMASGFVTGEEGLGHAVIWAADPAASERFYVELLGMRLSDRVRIPLSPDFTLEIRFLHANARHHTIAFASVPMPKRLHHFMLEVRDVDDVGRARDRALAAGVPLTMDLGRHPNDRMLSFYAKTPSGFAVEVGHGGIKVDDATWSVRTYDHVSVWGHQAPATPGA